MEPKIISKTVQEYRGKLDEDEKTNSFTIEGGLIVHNCDTLRYLCMSRPVVVEVPKSQMALEEQWYKDFNPKNYSTNRK